MATITANTLIYLTSDAEYRAHIQAISNAMSAVGWAKTADTGQIDTATATKPASGIAAGYEIWAMTDALQSTSPVFIKLNYKMYSATFPSVDISIGNATNGAGNLAGPGASYVTTMFANTGPAGVYYPTMASGAPNRVCMILGANTASAQWNAWFSVEREKNADGTDNGSSAVLLVSVAFNNSGRGFRVFFDGSATHGDGNYVTPTTVLYNSSGGTLSYRGSIPVSPLFLVSGKVYPPGIGMMAYHQSDIAKLSLFAVSVYGAVHNYMALGVPYVDGGSYTAGAMLWE